ETRPSILVRMFDKNGEYLRHFTTAERFTPFPIEKGLHEVTNYSPYGARHNSRENIRFLLIGPKQTELAYPVNLRDLRDVSIVEIGFLFTRNREMVDPFEVK